MTYQQLAKRTGRNGAQLHVAHLMRMAGICCVWVVLVCAGWCPNIAESFGEQSPSVIEARGAGPAGELRQRQVAFLHRVRHADPRHETIEQAVFNAHTELGVILNRHVNMDDVRPLMRTLLTQMAQDFPGHDLTVIAYAPSEPPMQIGTARLDVRTREMTYTPAVRQ
jgi:hypothetical protein